jgi:DNA polymerase-1
LREQAKREAINAPIQGSASDLIKKAMVDGFRLIQDERLDAELVLQIHDELLFEVAERSLEAFVPKVRRAMEHAIELCVPLQVDVRLGKTYGRLRDLKQDL